MHVRPSIKNENKDQKDLKDINLIKIYNPESNFRIKTKKDVKQKIKIIFNILEKFKKKFY